MINPQFANLGPEQLKEIKNLEEKLEVTLIAYNHFPSEGQSQQEQHSDVINPS